MLRLIETSDYSSFYAHENNTLFGKSILLCTKADLTTIQNRVNKQDIIEVCTQERQNTECRFKLITNMTIFAALLRRDVQILWFLNHFWRITMLIVWFRIKTQNNHTMTLCVCFEGLQLIYLEQQILKHPFPRSSMIFGKDRVVIRNNFREFWWIIYQ